MKKIYKIIFIIFFICLSINTNISGVLAKTNMEDFFPSGKMSSITILYGVNQASLLNGAYLNSDDITEKDKSEFYAKYYQYLKISLDTLNKLNEYVTEKEDFPDVFQIKWDYNNCRGGEYILNYEYLLADADNYLNKAWFEYLNLEREQQIFHRGPGCMWEDYYRNRLSKLYKFIYHYPDFPLIDDVKREIDNIEINSKLENENTPW